MENERLEPAERSPVGDRPKDVQMKPLRDAESEKTEEKPVSDLHGYDVVEEEEPPEGDLLPDTGHRADNCTLRDDEFCGTVHVSLIASGQIV